MGESTSKCIYEWGLFCNSDGNLRLGALIEEQHIEYDSNRSLRLNTFIYERHIE